MRNVTVSSIFALALAFSTYTVADEIDCEVLDWITYVDKEGDQMIEGETTCRNGYIILRLYSKEGKFLGTTEGDIYGYVFAIYREGALPPDFAIKYSIEDESPWEETSSP